MTRPSEWLATVTDHHDLRELPVDFATTVRATKLPAIHADPIDRILIATAEIQGLQVVTADGVCERDGVEVLRRAAFQDAA